MMDLIRSPHAFPVAIVCLYAATCARYAFAGMWGNVMYWLCAAGITVSATWLVGK
jgi:hypothetical protein